VLKRLFTGCVFFIAAGAAADAATAPVHVAKASVAPVMNGVAQGPAWTDALHASSFTDFTTRSASALPTQAYFTYDDRNVYVAFTCDQAGIPIKSSGNLNDLAAQSVDFVEVQIDTSGNGSRVYRFDATPNGLRTQYSSESSRFDPSWSAAGVTNGNGYSVTMAIPIRAMRIQRTTSQTWRVNFVRHVAETSSDLTWSYDTGLTDVRFDTRYWVAVEGVRIAQTSLVQPAYADVYALESAGSDRAAYGSLAKAVREPRVLGADVNVPITSSVSFVGTLHPDFSNVDRDQFTIAPQEFRQTLREYRPFFAQGANYVAPLPFAGIATVNVTPFYTPNIGVFDTGFKVEGTQGLSSFGILNVGGANFNDSALGYTYQTPDQGFQFALQQVTTHHEYGSDSTTGASLLSQNKKSGFFANVELLANRGTYVTKPSDADAVLAAAGLHNAHWNVGVQYEDVGPQFAPADGYVANTDVRGPSVFADYIGTPAGGWLKSYEAEVYADRFINRSGGFAQSDGGYYLSLRTRSLFSFTVSSNTSRLAEYAGGWPDYGSTTSLPFDLTTVGVGYKDGTSSPVDVSYGWGAFTVFCQQQTFCGSGRTTVPSAVVRQPGLYFSHQLSQSYGLSVLYSGTIESTAFGSDSQWLRRISLSRSVGKRGSFNVSLRTISGTGGNAIPGTNVSAGLDLALENRDHVYVELGSPSSVRTLNRVLFKYVFHLSDGRRR